MQVIFLVLTALVVAVFAGRAGRKALAWGAIAAVVFLIVDTIIALILLAALEDPSDELVFFTVILEKLVVSVSLVAIFRYEIRKRSTEQPEASEVQTNEQTGVSIAIPSGYGLRWYIWGAAVLGTLFLIYLVIKIIRGDISW